MSRTDVVVASRIYWPEPAAAAFRLRALAEALAHEGAQVHVVTTAVPGLATDDPAEAVTVSRFPVLRNSEGQVRGYLQYLSFDIPLALRLLGRRRPDVIVCEPPPTTGAVVRAVAGLRRVPYVYYAADIWSDALDSVSAPRLVRRLMRTVERWALEGAAQVIAVSDGVRERAELLGGADVTVVPNGVDTTVFTVDGAEVTAVEKEGAGVSGPYVIYAGTASEWQGAGVFIEALEILGAEHPDLHLVYMGQGSDWPALQAMAARSSAKVRFLPLQAPAEAARWIRGAVASVVSIVPGRGYDFAYPTKIFSSLACGTPVVYAGVGPAVPDIRESGLGEVCAHDAGAAAQALRAVLRSPGDPVRLHRWVEENKSLASTRRRAAALVMACARR